MRLETRNQSQSGEGGSKLQRIGISLEDNCYLCLIPVIREKCLVCRAYLNNTSILWKKICFLTQKNFELEMYAEKLSEHKPQSVDENCW